MLSSSDDDAAAGTAVYLAPQDFSDRRNIGRQFSVNDSGIVELHGSRSSSRIGSSVPNDSYRGFDSDQENFPGTPRAFYPAMHWTNGHTPVSTQFPFPLSSPTSKQMRNNIKDCEEVSIPNRHKDDTNVYTSIDEASLVFHSRSASKTGELAPLATRYRQPGSRQVSTDSGQARGRENIVYEHPKVDRRVGKAKPLSGKCCFGFFCHLFAVAALCLTVVQLTRTSSNADYEQLYDHYKSLKAENEELNQSLHNFEDRFNAMLTEKLIELANYDNTISNLFLRLLSNDSDLQQRLLDSFEDKMDLLKTEISLKISSTEKEISELVSSSDNQLRMHLSGLMSINMSACEYNYQSYGTSATEEEHRTDLHDFSDKFVLRVFCTTEGGTETTLEYTATKPNEYGCSCKGRHNEASSRFCILHFWTCPYI